MKDKILFVCQRCGEQINGGAEAECRMYATRLTPYYDVEVLTTCAIDYVTWKNELPSGESMEEGVLVRRFPVLRERETESFARLSAGIASDEGHTRAEEERWLDAQGPYAPALIDWLHSHAAEYRAVLFMTYLYYTTARGLPGCPGVKLLIPTAHDEWPIRQSVYNDVFEAADSYIYNSEAERRFAERRFPQTAGKPYITIGAGVEEWQGELPDVRERFGLTGDYILYAGRIDSAKGCGELFENFAAYKALYGGELKLALIGKAAMPIPEREDIVHLGFVSEAEKYALMRSARCFVLSSHFESLSIVVLESMLMGRPVLVSEHCEVLHDHAVHSGAGLWFRGKEDFCAALYWLMTHPDECDRMGQRGRRYVRENYRWPGIVTRLRALIELTAKGRDANGQ